MNKYSSKYDNFILLGDLNSEPTEPVARDFSQIYSCKNLIIDNICFKNLEKPSCKGLIITNRPTCFQNSVTLEAELSDFHKMTLTVMKVFYKKRPTIITYPNYKNYSNDVLWRMFRTEYLKWPPKTTTLSLIFSKQYLMKLFKNNKTIKRSNKAAICLCKSSSFYKINYK